MSTPWFVQPGIILFTERFEACVAFYRVALGLPVVFDKGHLICLGFGAAYLMIEKEGAASDGAKSRAQNPTILRFNVVDVEAAADLLRGRGIDVEIATFDWGTIGKFQDPDGNLGELRNHTGEFTVPGAAS